LSCFAEGKGPRFRKTVAVLITALLALPDGPHWLSDGFNRKRLLADSMNKRRLTDPEEIAGNDRVGRIWAIRALVSSA